VDALKFKLARTDASAGAKQLPEVTKLLNSIRDVPVTNFNRDTDGHDSGLFFSRCFQKESETVLCN